MACYSMKKNPEKKSPDHDHLVVNIFYNYLDLLKCSHKLKIKCLHPRRRHSHSATLRCAVTDFLTAQHSTRTSLATEAKFAYAANG